MADNDQLIAARVMLAALKALLEDAKHYSGGMTEAVQAQARDAIAQARAAGIKVEG